MSDSHINLLARSHTLINAVAKCYGPHMTPAELLQCRILCMAIRDDLKAHGYQDVEGELNLEPPSNPAVFDPVLHMCCTEITEGMIFDWPDEEGHKKAWFTVQEYHGIRPTNHHNKWFCMPVGSDPSTVPTLLGFDLVFSRNRFNFRAALPN